MSGWQVVLGRVLDGEAISPEESAALQAALSDEHCWNLAREWMCFEFTLYGHGQDDSLADLSRDRLVARVILREKHQQLVTGSTSSMAAGDPVKVSTRLQGTGNPRHPGRRWTRGAVALVILVVVFAVLRPDISNRSYAGPTAQGDYRVLGVADPTRQRPVERGDRIVTGGQGARIELGRYCRLELDAHTEVTLRGVPHHEVVELHQGHLQAQITPDHGQFRVQTPLGPVTVRGTLFDATVEYPNGMPGDLSRSRAKRVVVTVGVSSGAVLCEFEDVPVLVEAGTRRVFTDEVENQTTSGHVLSSSGSTVTLSLEEGESATFHVGDNKLAQREAREVVEGDRVTITWVRDGGRRWVRDIEGQGQLDGTVTALEETWLEIETGGRRVKLRAPWRGGNPSDGGGPDRDVVRQLGQVRVGDEVTASWAMPEGKRVMDLRLRRAEDQTQTPVDSPPGLEGFRGILVGELVSKDLEKGALVFRMEKVQRVWKANRASNPEESKGKLITVDGISGRFLDVLRSLEAGTRIEVEAFQVQGKVLKFPGEWLRKAQ